MVATILIATSNYNNIIRMLTTIVTTSILVFCIKTYSTLKTYDEYANAAEKLEKQIALYEQQSNEVSTNIETKVVEKIKVVKDTVYVTKEKIKEHKIYIDANCTVPDVAWMLYNDAVNGTIPLSTKNINGTSNTTKTIK